jgi:hypothetical protein
LGVDRGCVPGRGWCSTKQNKENTMANLQAAEAIRYISSVEESVRRQLDHIIGTLVNLVR